MEVITNPIDVLSRFPVRKSKKQKTAFQREMQAFATARGFDVKIEKGSFGAQNIVIGDPETARYLITAHYDTCAWMPIPNFITPCNFAVYLIYQLLVSALLLAIAFVLALGTAALINPDVFVPFFGVYAYVLIFLLLLGPANRHNANDNTSGVVTVLEILHSLPENQRKKVCFVLFDLEEAGLFGSAAYRKAHKNATNRQIVLNLDCVGDGDQILMFPSKKIRKDPDSVTKLERIQCQCGSKQLVLHQKGFAFCPSDQSNFPLGVGIMAFHRNKLLGLYCNRIHTSRDTILEQTNVNILRAAIISLICQ